MICKNPHCKNKAFAGVIESGNNVLVGVKCMSCGARYSIDEIDILKSVKRDGYWNSVKWGLGR